MKIANGVFYYGSFVIAKVLGIFLFFLEKFGGIFLLYFFAGKICNYFDPDNGGVVERSDYDPISKMITKRAILALPSFGCSYYFDSGGCEMCGFNKEIEKYGFRKLHKDALYLLVKIFVLNLEGKIKREKCKYSTLVVFMAGSFLNKKEFTEEIQDLIIDFFINSIFEKIIIESRPEYVLANIDKILTIKNKIKDKHLKINIGFESVNNVIRNCYIKKGISLDVFVNSVRLLKNAGVYVGAYILIGSPYLSVDEIITETINSVNFCWENGVDLVNLEVYCVQKGTKWESLYLGNKLELPSLQAVVKVIREIDKISSQWYLGEFSDWPIPVATPKGCDECSEKILVAFSELRKRHDVSVFNSLPNCKCVIKEKNMQ